MLCIQELRLFWIHTTINFFKIFFIFSMCVKIFKGCLDEKKISIITEISLLITHHCITHFLSPNNDEISLKARLAPKAQLCFQPKKLKKLGTTDWALCSATEGYPRSPSCPHILLYSYFLQPLMGSTNSFAQTN